MQYLIDDIRGALKSATDTLVVVQDALRENQEGKVAAEKKVVELQEALGVLETRCRNTNKKLTALYLENYNLKKEVELLFETKPTTDAGSALPMLLEDGHMVVASVAGGAHPQAESWAPFPAELVVTYNGESVRYCAVTRNVDRD